jgi:NAD-dependent dihydropyrimidine dehydrogenase PreA subunit
VVRSAFEVMKASEWEKEDAMREGIPIINNRPPKEFVHENGKLKGVLFECVTPVRGEDGRLRYEPSGEPDEFIECDHVLMAIGQDNHCPWIERDLGIEFDKWDCPNLNEVTLQSTNPSIFFGGDSAFGPENIIWASAHAHRAAISIHLYCQGKDLINDRPPEGVNLLSTKMGVHEWAYDAAHDPAERHSVPLVEHESSLNNLKVEVELGFDAKLAAQEAQRSFVDNQPEEALRLSLTAPAQNLGQDLYVSGELKTQRVMVKDEDVCLHCGLCAERCPTNAWDMQRSVVHIPQLGSFGE